MRPAPGDLCRFSGLWAFDARTWERFFLKDAIGIFLETGGTTEDGWSYHTWLIKGQIMRTWHLTFDLVTVISQASDAYG